MATKIGFFAGTYRKTQKMMTLKELRKRYAIEQVEIVQEEGKEEEEEVEVEERRVL